jgi:hypothetical protein
MGYTEAGPFQDEGCFKDATKLVFDQEYTEDTAARLALALLLEE